METIVGCSLRWGRPRADILSYLFHAALESTSRSLLHRSGPLLLRFLATKCQPYPCTPLTRARRRSDSRAGIPNNAFTLATCAATSVRRSAATSGEWNWRVHVNENVSQLVAQLVSSVNGSSNILGHKLLNKLLNLLLVWTVPLNNMANTSSATSNLLLNLLSNMWLVWKHFNSSASVASSTIDHSSNLWRRRQHSATFH